MTAKKPAAKRPATMSEREKARRWDALMGHTPSKSEQLWSVYEAANEKHTRAIKACARAHTAVEKAWDAQEAAYAAWKAQSDREIAESRARRSE